MRDGKQDDVLALVLTTYKITNRPSLSYRNCGKNNIKKSEIINIGLTLMFFCGEILIFPVLSITEWLEKGCRIRTFPDLSSVTRPMTSHSLELIHQPR